MSSFRYSLLLSISIISSTSYLSANSFIMKTIPRTNADFVVIGAGAAGLGAIATLDHIGVDRSRITWIDRDFTGGDLANYPEVPANAKNQNFVNFFKACKIFSECPCPSIQKLFDLPREQEDLLINVITPIIEATEYVRTKIPSHQGMVTGLNFDNDVWHICLDDNRMITSTHVILATGSTPNNLGYNGGTIVPLAAALTPTQLKDIVEPEDMVTVVGGAHSAVLVLRNLVNMKKTGKPPRKIINLFNTDIIYMEEVDGGYLHAYSGVKGAAARWAHEFLDRVKGWPENLIRLKNTPENRKMFLKESDKIVYACGFKPNSIPINGETGQTEFDYQTGEITGSNVGPRLFGIGLAYPEIGYDSAGNKENMIGLEPFMEYAQSMIPEWVTRMNLNPDEASELLAQYRTRRSELSKYTDLFTIEVL